MMRRAGRGSHEQAPWRGHDIAIPGHVSCCIYDTWAKAVGLAAVSIAISIVLMWSLVQPHRRPYSGSPHLLSQNYDDLLSRKPGFVFPLYEFYHKYANGSREEAGREGSGVAGHGRGIRSLNPVYNLRWVHRHPGDMNREIYIEMKLGDPPMPFYLHVDTASGLTWVYCFIEDPLAIRPVGPNRLLLLEDESIMKCTGPTERLCRALQHYDPTQFKCTEEEEYICTFLVKYADRSVYSGIIVNESMTLSLQDTSERSVFGAFGCVLEKRNRWEKLPLLTDGVVGLGRCEGSFVDQLWKSKAIRHKVLAVCLAKEMPRRRQGLRPVGPVGFISLGMDFQEKFNGEDDMVWSQLMGPEQNCMLTSKLLSIEIGNRRISSFSGTSMEAGIMMAFDTGAENTFFCKDVYDPLLEALVPFTSNGQYIRAQDPEISSRVCWEYRGKKGTTKRGRNSQAKAASPIGDFPTLEFGFEALASMESPLPTALHYLIVKPENYLAWDADKKLVCMNIYEEYDDPEWNLLGIQMLGEQLFVFDMENHRVRWTPSSECEL